MEVLKIEEESLCVHLHQAPDTSIIISPTSSSYGRFIDMRTLGKVQQNYIVGVKKWKF